jgi:hypothetical protein
MQCLPYDKDREPLKRFILTCARYVLVIGRIFGNSCNAKNGDGNEE